MPRCRGQLAFLSAVALLLGAVGCGGTGATATYPLGGLSAKVVDANNAGVEGILLDLYRVEGGTATLWRASRSGSDGIGEFGASEGGVIAGKYVVRVRFVTQYELAAGQTNDRPVTVNEGDKIVITFRVIQKTTDHPLAEITVLSNGVG